MTTLDAEPAGPVPARPASTVRIVLLGTEFLTLFGAGPFLYYFDIIRPPLIPMLCSLCALCATLLLVDKGFDRRQLWNRSAVGAGVLPVVIRFAVGAAIIAAGVAFYAPDKLFGFVRHDPAFWFLVMVAYPVFSVYPQELIFRTFLFHRYRDLFPHPHAMVVASAAAFGFAHVIFQNPLAVPLTFIGGAIFAWTYMKRRSTLLCSIEHALYGDFIFTIGLGAYFYAGGIS